MNDQIEIYQGSDGRTQIEVKFEKETVWLTQEQMVILFQRDQSVVSRHIRNVFKENELDEKSNMQKMHIAHSDKPVALYSLDVIISVGYRVKSQRGTQFRQWATQRLKDYLVQGYAINETKQEYEKALARLAIIFEADPDSAKGMEAELLVTLIEKYENEHYPVSIPDPIDAIRETMERKVLKDKDLIPAIGSKTTVSLVLNRKRALTIDIIRKLSELLGLPLRCLFNLINWTAGQKQLNSKT